MAHELFGRKVGMTQIFDDKGKAIPVTVIQVGPCVVTGTRTDAEKGGYNAVQIAFDEIPAKRANKPRTGHFAKAGVAPHRHLREFRVDSAEAAGAFEAGQVLDASVFEGVEWVDVRGTTKGRGFAGVIKRHGFKGAKEASHGTHEYFRHGGAIGMSAWPSRVHKGKRMAGQLGNVQRTAMNLKVVGVKADKGVILVKGSVPGPNKGLLVVRPAARKG